MKRHYLALAILCAFVAACYSTSADAAARPNSKKGIYFVQGLTGGGAGALDTLDITGASTPNQYDLIDGDCAIAGTISGTTTTYYFYIFDVDATDAESSPTIIRPDDYATAGVWRLSRMSLSMIQNAVADGATKGVASFNADHFDASSGIISLDTTNGPFIADIVEDTTPQLGGTLDPNGNAITGYLPSIDEDNMASDSAAYVPTQQSVKAYADTKESGTSNDIDPDRLDGDTTDDNLIDQDIIEGFSGSATPMLLLKDSNAAGADAADEEAGVFHANMTTTTEDLEDSDIWFTIMQGGARTIVLTFDESDDRWETTKDILVPTEVYDATNWNGDLTVPTKDAVRDKIETISGISNVVEDTTPQLGGDLDLNTHVITGMVIGTNIQAYDADLTTWAGVTPGTGIATALAVNVGTAGAPVVNGGALGTPSGGTLTNATGLPIASGVSGLGSNVATFLATPSSANLATAVTGETGSGAVVFGTSPTLVTPALGTPSALVLTNATGLPSGGITTIVDSIAWTAAGFNVDGTQCADAAAVQINSGPYQSTVICADNDGSTMYGNIVMPDGWDGGTLTFEGAYLQTAADTSALNSDIAMMCRGAGETVNNTWGTEIALDDAAVTGSNGVDHTTTAAITPNGTCAGGDTLYWRWQLDATGTTTAVATLHFLGAKIEYTDNVGD